MVEFDEEKTGDDAMFGEPYWISKCKRFRLCNFVGYVRPWRIFRRTKTKGWPWIGVGSGCNSREAAVAEINTRLPQHVINPRKKK